MCRPRRSSVCTTSSTSTASQPASGRLRYHITGAGCPTNLSSDACAGCCVERAAAGVIQKGGGCGGSLPVVCERLTAVFATHRRREAARPAGRDPIRGSRAIPSQQRCRARLSPAGPKLALAMLSQHDTELFPSPPSLPLPEATQSLRDWREVTAVAADVLEHSGISHKTAADRHRAQLMLGLNRSGGTSAV